jgi:glycosyltransferase involved in cell wall biosynthesis
MKKASKKYMDSGKSSFPLAGWKIISINVFWEKPVTGGEIYNDVVYRSLLDNGASVRLLNLPLIKGKGIVNIRNLIQPILWLGNMLSLDNRYVIAVDNFYAPLIAIPILLLRIFTSTRIIVFNHTVRTRMNPLKMGLALFFEKLVLRFSNLVVVNSNLTYKLMGMSKIHSKVYHLSPPITVKPNFVDRRKRRYGFVSFLYAGSIVEKKRLHIIIQSLALCKDFNWQLRVAGNLNYEPQYYRMCRQLIEKNRLNNKVVFLGYLDNKQIEQEFIDADIFILPSRVESYGMVYMEAAAKCLPIISTYTGAVAEYFTPDENVCIVPYNDIHTLAKSISKLAKDQELRCNLGENAYRQIDLSYGIEQMYNRATDILCDIIPRGKRKITHQKLK